MDSGCVRYHGFMVSWEWPDGLTGAIWCSDETDALAAWRNIDLRCRVWIGDEMIRGGIGFEAEWASS